MKVRFPLFEFNCRLSFNSYSRISFLPNFFFFFFHTCLRYLLLPFLFPFAVRGRYHRQLVGSFSVPPATYSYFPRTSTYSPPRASFSQDSYVCFAAISFCTYRSD